MKLCLSRRPPPEFEVLEPHSHWEEPKTHFLLRQHMQCHHFTCYSYNTCSTGQSFQQPKRWPGFWSKFNELPHSSSQQWNESRLLRNMKVNLNQYILDTTYGLYTLFQTGNTWLLCKSFIYFGLLGQITSLCLKVLENSWLNVSSKELFTIFPTF